MTIHTVSDVNRYLKALFTSDPSLHNVMIRGEISNFKCYQSGHCYFTLKDANAALKCVMFKSSAQHLRFQPQNGMQVLAGGNITVYERDGVYQLYANTLTPEGTGDLALAFEQLKAKLTAEGLFESSNKKPLVRFPKTIGVVTSPTGAVLRDIYRVAKRRWPMVKLVLYPVQVQGDIAAAQIAKGIAFFNKHYPVDTLIVGRGGGSIEDLWSFNEEIVVRAIAASKIPLISAVGHETDFTLADFAADVRAATPSQAAELAVPDRADLQQYILGLYARLQNQSRRGLEARRLQLQAVLQSRALTSPQLLLASRQQRLDMILDRLKQLAQTTTIKRHHEVQLLLEKLAALNPATVLSRGFVAAAKKATLINSARQLAIDDTLDLTLQDGTAKAVVTAVTIFDERKDN